MKCATSLWSADLANLAAEIRRVEAYSERFHLDVADGHYVPTLLFFPDLVAALRPFTQRPFEVHLMTTDPVAWIAPFCDAGADGFIVCADSCADLPHVVRTIKDRGKLAAVSLRIEEPLERLDSVWDLLDQVTIFGTRVGIKGASLEPSIPAKVEQARELIAARRRPIEIEVDGGIRRESVPRLKAAGADWIVPGSLMFKEDPRVMRAWLASL
jgi:ribulose-phosphate 3-epimerase